MIMTEKRIDEIDRKTDHLKKRDPAEVLIELADVIMWYAERNVIETIEPPELRKKIRAWREHYRNTTTYWKPVTQEDQDVFSQAVEKSRMWLTAALVMIGFENLTKEDRAAALAQIKELSPVFKADPARGQDLAVMVTRWSQVYDIDLIEKFIPDAKGQVKHGSY